MGAVPEDWAAVAALAPRLAAPPGPDPLSSPYPPAADDDDAATRATAGDLETCLSSLATSGSTMSFFQACKTRVVGIVNQNLFGPTIQVAAPVADVRGPLPAAVPVPSAAASAAVRPVARAPPPQPKPRPGPPNKGHLVLI